MTPGTETISNVEIPTKEGKATNELEVVDFTVTKIWKENGADRKHTATELATDSETLKNAYTIQESNKALTLNGYKPTTATAYDATARTGTLEIKVGEPEGDNPTTVFVWHNIPKYALDKETTGKVVGKHEAVYSVIETTLNGYNDPTYSDTDKALNEGTITNEVTPPEGTPKETWGEKNQPQSTNGKDLFKTTTNTQSDGTPNVIEKVELLDENGNPADTVKVDGGTYTIDEDGKITFTPDTDFVGDPPAVTVRGTDSNGLSNTTTYTPHVVDVVKKVTRTIVYEYENGDPVLGPDNEPLIVIQEVEFYGTVNPDTGEIVYPVDASDTMEEVESDEIDGYYVDKEKVGEAVVYPNSDDLFEKVIYSPKGVKATGDVTYGLPDEPQTGTPTFEMDTPTYTDGSPNEVTIKLVDPETGEPTDEKTVTIPGQGSYTLNDDGTITFTPEDGYVGNPDPIEVIGTDRFGSTAKTTYTPHIVDPVSQDNATRTIYYTYETEDGEPVTDSVKQTVTLTRHAKEVDPKTGEVLEWGDWQPATFPAVDNPDDKVDLRIWTADSSASELTVTKPGPVDDVHVVYKKVPYSVVYEDGEHGKSDGKGNQEGEDYGSDVKGGNTVTPDPGYHFTGEYEYVITDKDGNVIERGTTDNPTSLKITGNIVFTPQYEPNKYTIKYDPNGGTGEMTDQNFTGEDKEAISKRNTFTRENYKFKGFKAKDKNGNYLKDENGNDLIFIDPADFIEYLHAQGDGGEITLVAQWQRDDSKYYIPVTGVE